MILAMGVEAIVSESADRGLAAQGVNSAGGIHPGDICGSGKGGTDVEPVQAHR